MVLDLDVVLLVGFQYVTVCYISNIPSSVCYITFSQVVDTLSTVYTKGTVAFWTLIHFFVHIMLVVSKTTTTNKKQASKHTKPG